MLQSLDNALKLLELLAEIDMEQGVTEISRQLGLGKSTVHRMLTTLESHDFVKQNMTNNKYRLGTKVMNLGASALRQTNIIRECRPYLEELSKQTGESTHLAIYSHGEITFIDKVKGESPSKMASMVGVKLPAYITATGKVLLAFLPREAKEAYLSTLAFIRYTPNTIVSRERLQQELEKISKVGFAYDLQESEEGLVCLAAPVRNGYGKVVAAISISGAASRLNEPNNELINLVKDTALSISIACGWSPTNQLKYTGGKKVEAN